MPWHLFTHLFRILVYFSKIWKHNNDGTQTFLRQEKTQFPKFANKVAAILLLTAKYLKSKTYSKVSYSHLLLENFGVSHIKTRSQKLDEILVEVKNWTDFSLKLKWLMIGRRHFQSEPPGLDSSIKADDH